MLHATVMSNTRNGLQGYRYECSNCLVFKVYCADELRGCIQSQERETQIKSGVRKREKYENRKGKPVDKLPKKFQSLPHMSSWSPHVTVDLAMANLKLVAKICQEKKGDVWQQSKLWNVFDYLLDPDSKAVAGLVNRIGGKVKPEEQRSRKTYSRFEVHENAFVKTDVVSIKVSVPCYYERQKGEPMRHQVRFCIIVFAVFHSCCVICDVVSWTSLKDLTWPNQNC